MIVAIIIIVLIILIANNSAKKTPKECPKYQQRFQPQEDQDRMYKSMENRLRRQKRIELPSGPIAWFKYSDIETSKRFG